MYKLIKIDEKTSDEIWQKLFDVRQNQKPIIEFTIESWQSMKETILGYFKDDESYFRYAIADYDNKIIGDFSCYEDENETENIGRVLRPRVNLLPEFQTDEIIGLILSKLVEHYDNNLKIRFIDENGLNDKWLEKWGGTFKIHLETHKLKYSDIDKDKLINWAETGKDKNPELKLRFCETKDLTETEMIDYIHIWNVGLGASLIREVIEKYNFKYQIPLQMIKSDIEANEKNEKHVCNMVLLFDYSGKIAGFTQIGIDFKIPKEYIDGKLVAEYLDKGMTYVKPEYRGKGLGKWMNAELYLKLREHYIFEEIESDMAPYNSYILNINREFGYKKLENSYEKEYIFELSEINKLLKV